MQAQILEEAVLNLDPRLPLAGNSPFYVPRHGESLAGLGRLFRQKWILMWKGNWIRSR